VTLAVNQITAAAGTGTITVNSSCALQVSGYNAQTVYKVFDTLTTTSATYTYVPVTDGMLSIVSKFDNSKFLVTMQAQGYASGTTGCNIGISRSIGTVTTRLIGGDGSTTGDAWAGAAYATNSYNIKRSILDSPTVPAGTMITYNMLCAVWSGGTMYLNYSGYTGGSTITIMEIAA
jgi:hypothetical protein